MSLEILYQILNNASVATIIGIELALFFARREYVQQKNQDRDSEAKLDVINDIVSLQEKVHYSLLVIDRIAHTWSITSMSTKEFLEKGLNFETSKLSNAINEEIPSLLIKISSKLNIYFNNPVVKEKFENFKEELKKWHDPIVKMQFDLKRRVKDQFILSPDKFDQETKFLVQTIWQEKTT